MIGIVRRNGENKALLAEPLVQRRLAELGIGETPHLRLYRFVFVHQELEIPIPYTWPDA